MSHYGETGKERPMGLQQVWRTEAIENILWSIQNLRQATRPKTKDQDPPQVYGRALNCGVEAGIRRVIESFETISPTLKIWTSEDVRTILNSVQVESQLRIMTSTIEKCPVECDRGFYQGLEAAKWCLATAFGINPWKFENGTVSGRTSPTYTSLMPWFREDVKNILLGLQEVLDTSGSFSEQRRRPAQFADGFEYVLQLVASSFGIRLILPGNPSLSESAMHYWHRHDVEKKLRIIYQSAPALANTSEETTEIYREAFLTAVHCIARSFGIDLARV